MAILKQVTVDGKKHNTQQIHKVSAIAAHQSAGARVQVSTTTGAATPTLVMADSGRTYLMDSTDGTIAYTLPAVAGAGGFHATFIFKIISDNDVTWTSGADNMIMSCTSFTASGAAQAHTTDTVTTVRYNADTVNSVVGDRLEVYCDGTNYMCVGMANTQGSAPWATS
jgi:hypothetical protein